MQTNKEDIKHRKAETDSVMRMLAASVRPDKEKIHSGVKHRLREMRMNDTGKQNTLYPYYKWAVSFGVFLAVFCISYYSLVRDQDGSVYCCLLPIGNAEISEISEKLSEPGYYHTKGRTITTLGKSKASLMHNQFTVRLNQLTSIFVESADRIRLDEGMLFADVEKRSRTSNPFSIEAGDLTVVVLGTQFSVERNGGQVTVAVKEGRVRLRTNQNESTVLTDGEQAVFSDQKIGETVKIAPDQVAPWSQTLIQEESKNKDMRSVMKEYYKSRLY